MSLTRLNKSKPTGYTGLCAYVWYAHKLRLQNAVNRMSTQISSYEERLTEERLDVQTEEQTEERLDVQTEEQTEERKDVQTEEQAEERTEVQTEEQRDGQPFSKKSYNLGNRTWVYEEGSSKSAAAARRRKDRRLEPVVNPKGQEPEKAERMAADVEALREVVRKLTPRDKIAQLHFDKVVTDLTSTYCRTEDRPYGCVLVFQLRSLLTAFSLTLSAYTITRHNGNPKLLIENIRFAEEIGLDVKAVACDRSAQICKTINNSPNSIFLRQRADGSNYLIAQMYDYLRLLNAIRHQDCKESGSEKLGHLGALKEERRQLTNYLSQKYDRNGPIIHTSNARKPEVCDAFRNACDIYKFIMLNHMVEENIGKRLQAIILARVAFFREAGSCPNGSSHRRNLLGFMTNLQLTGENWVQATIKNVSSCSSLVAAPPPHKSAPLWSLPRRLISTKVHCMPKIDQFTELCNSIDKLQVSPKFTNFVQTKHNRTDYPPVANAGEAVILYLPNNSVTLNGLKRPVMNLKQSICKILGHHMYRLIINLPINWVVLNGSSLADDIGLKCYEWKEVQGPNAAVILKSNETIANATGLSLGLYAFALTAADTSNNTASDCLWVQEKNSPPAANAGGDQSVTLSLPTINSNKDSIMILVLGHSCASKQKKPRSRPKLQKYSLIGTQDTEALIVSCHVIVLRM
uniref:Uncharacterized protein n=1 Tax=Glossina palpalis gambiensis TaxID=67801 RepID=A0A1B0C022_9MUSC